MPRPKKCRRICTMPECRGFLPMNKGEDHDEVVITFDEYEAIRLIDLEKLSQEQCAKQMNVARTTVTAIYDKAREKLGDALVNGKKLLVDGGNVVVCEHNESCCDRRCLKSCSNDCDKMCDKGGCK